MRPLLLLGLVPCMPLAQVVTERTISANGAKCAQAGIDKIASDLGG